MEDSEVLRRIGDLVQQEHQLQGLAEGHGMDERDKDRLESLEVTLDQCWDLLRQRRARRHAGQEPDQAKVRDSGTVERYLQ